MEGMVWGGLAVRQNRGKGWSGMGFGRMELGKCPGKGRRGMCDMESGVEGRGKSTKWGRCNYELISFFFCYSVVGLGGSSRESNPEIRERKFISLLNCLSRSKFDWFRLSSLREGINLANSQYSSDRRIKQVLFSRTFSNRTSSKLEKTVQNDVHTV